jgi:PhnB protein
VLGAQVGFMMRFKESPDKPPPGTCAPGSDDKIMHASFTVNGTMMMASDGRADGKPEFKGFSLSIDARDEADADQKFAALSAGGQVIMPPGETFFAKRFGMCTDKFGVGWMITAGAKNP